MKTAKLISYTFHPAIIPTIAILIYFLLIPFIPYAREEKFMVLAAVFLGTYILPILILILFMQMRIIESLQIPKVEERKYPTVLMLVVGIVFFYLFSSKLNNTDLAQLFLRSSLSISLLFVAQLNKQKLSIHMMAMGVLLGFTIHLSANYQLGLLLPIAILVLTAGLVASSRLSLKAHTNREIILGFLLGLVPQFHFF